VQFGDFIGNDAYTTADIYTTGFPERKCVEKDSQFNRPAHLPEKFSPKLTTGELLELF
jgi:hypothetical protein